MAEAPEGSKVIELAKADPFRYRIRFLVLTLLALKPSHGYELSKKIEEFTRGFIRPSPGSVYPLLRELKEEGLVEEDLVVEKGRARKIYKLTRKGEETILHELNVFYDIMNGIFEIAVAARRSLEEKLAGRGKGCIPRSIVKGLERLRDVVDNYLKALKDSDLPYCEEDTD